MKKCIYIKQFRKPRSITAQERGAEDPTASPICLAPTLTESLPTERGLMFLMTAACLSHTLSGGRREFILYISQRCSTPKRFKNKIIREKSHREQ